MENLIDEIDKYYQISKSAKTDWHFFLGLNDYIEFIKSKKEMEPILDQLTKQRKTFEKTLIPIRKKNRLDANIRLERKRDVEYWGDLYRLELVSKIISLNKDYKYSDDEDLNKLQNEMKMIEKDGHPYVGILDKTRYENRANYSSDKDEEIEEFKKKKYEFYANRIHNYLIQQLKLNNIPQKEQEAIMPHFEIKVKDREIWINDYFLSKPYATGINFEFFEYIRNQPKNSKIEKGKLPEALERGIGTTTFSKLLNNLGFTGEITKTFFHKVDKSSLRYRGDKVFIKDIERAGVKIPVLIKQLELAHIKRTG